MGGIGSGPFADAISRYLWKNTILLVRDIVNTTHHNKKMGPK